MDRFTKHLKDPFAGVSQLLERAKLPGFDAGAMIAARRRDIDAVLEANRIVYAGAQALAQKQFDILRTTMAGARSAVVDGSFSGNPIEIATKQRELMVKAFQAAIGHMRDLAEIVRTAQVDAFSVVKGQAEHDLRELVGRVQRRGKAEAAPAAKAKPARKAPVKAKAKPAAKPRAKAKPAAKARAKAKPAAKGKAKAKGARKPRP